MFPFGHFALSYFLAIILKRYIKEKHSLPLVILLSISPDLDIFFKPYLVHRGPTHSIITITLIFTMYFLLFRKGSLYYVSVLSHLLIGDYITANGLQLLWPITKTWYKAPAYLHLNLSTQMIVELILFGFVIIHMIQTNVFEKIKTRSSNHY